MANSVRFKASIDDQVSGKLDKIRDNFDRLGKSKGAATILQGVGMGAGISAWNLLGNAAGKAADFMGESVKAASDQREAMALTAQVFKQNTAAMEEWAANKDDAFSTTEALTFASTFGTAMSSVGMSLDETTEKSQTLVKLAGDLGSAFNTSSEEAAQALRSGLIGESEPMRRFGVFLSEAAVQAKAVEKGIAKAGEKLSDTQKVAARYAIIMEQTAESQGMFGRDAESMADALKRAETRMEDAKAALGRGLLPFVVQGAEDFALLATAIGTAGEALEDFLNISAADDASPLDAFSSSVIGLVRGVAVELGNVAEHFRVVLGIAPEEKFEGMVRGFGRTATAADRAADRTEDLADANKRAAANFAKVRDRARQAAERLKDIEDAADDARDALFGTAKQPKELELELKGAKLEGKDLADKLAELEGKKPTRQVRQDIIDTKLAIMDNQREVATLEGDLVRLGEVSLQKHENTIERLARNWGLAEDQVRAYLRALNQVPGAAVPRPGANNRYAPEPRASGGPVLPGRTYTVGEAGMETLVMGQTGGYVLPNGRGGGSGGGGNMVPVSLPIVIDGREIARVVDRHLYYEAARAPRSSYAG